VSAETKIFEGFFFLHAVISAVHRRPRPAPQAVLESSQGRRQAAAGLAGWLWSRILVLGWRDGKLSK